jgi:hypothetical protein
MDEASLAQLKGVVPLQGDVHIEGVTLELVSLEAWTTFTIVRCAKAINGSDADIADAQRIASVENHRALDQVVLGEGPRPRREDLGMGGRRVGICGGDSLEVDLRFAPVQDPKDLWLGYRDDAARRWPLVPAPAWRGASPEDG